MSLKKEKENLGQRLEHAHSWVSKGRKYYSVCRRRKIPRIIAIQGDKVHFAYNTLFRNI